MNIEHNLYLPQLKKYLIFWPFLTNCDNELGSPVAFTQLEILKC